MQTVTEEKFSILFQSQFSVGGGELVFQVWVSVRLFFCRYIGPYPARDNMWDIIYDECVEEKRKDC